MSFWTIRDAKKDDKDFLNAVDGKTPEEVIILGKEIYQERKASGFKGYEQYTSWEQMITKFGKERNEQENKVPKSKEQQNIDKANDVLYKL